MAKIKFGALAEDARGKIDGIVYSRNQFGAYARQKVSPVQPQTARQTLVRERMTTLSKRFSTVISEADRLAWSAFAKVNPVVDVFGNPQALSGISAYNRLNGVILNAGGTRIDTPPADLEVTGLLSMSVAASAGGGTLAITFSVSALGAAERLYIWASQGLNSGREFFKPSLRFIGVSAAAQATPFAAGALYTAKFGSMIQGTAIGVLVGVCDRTKGAVTPGIFARVIVAA
jgi:hypothetical protein